MKFKLFCLVITLCLTCLLYSGFFSKDEHPRWNIDPRTAVNFSNEYVDIPGYTNDIMQFSLFPKKQMTPIGILTTFPNVRIHPSSNTQQSECPITRNPVNPNIVFASSNATNFTDGAFINSGIYVSTDGGLSWTGKDTVNTINLNDQRGDPGPIIDKNGNFILTHLTSLFNFGGVTGMGSNYSTDNGLTWSATIQIDNDAGADKNLGASDDSPGSPYYGNSYLAWTTFSTNRAHGRTSRTTDGGRSWSIPLSINTSPAGHNAHGHDVAVSPGGNVFVVWASCNTGFPFTEDFIGVAKSVDGGISYTTTENAFDVNGTRSLAFNGWGIRTNGFPRIAIDKSGGQRNGWIYIVTSDKFLEPADSCDVILRRSTDNGTTWSSRIRVNQDPANNHKQFFPAICVDDAGNVNVVYYDNRNFRTYGDSCSVFISKSIDGGDTWTDIEIADHHFLLKSINQIAGYMGDYIGITASAGKVIAIWMDDKAGAPGTYNAWTGALEISKDNVCENFSSNQFPPSSFYFEFSGINYWSLQTQSAYDSGNGSSKFNSFLAPAGTMQSLTSLNFPSADSATYLTFDEAYAPKPTGTDSLIVEASGNGGTSYLALVRLWGNAAGGTLNSAPAQAAEFTPANSQWRSKIYLLPVGTNKVRFRARSGAGNDIWVDNICIQSLPTAVANTIGIVPEGIWLNAPPYISFNDTIRVYLHRTDFPNIRVDSAISIISNGPIANNLMFSRALTGTYFKVVKYRNTIETWSKSPGQLYTRGSNTHFNFLTPAGQAFANNQKLVNPFPYYAMFGGDVDQDYIVDASDLSLIDNAAFIELSGYVREDLTGDNFVDASDLSIAHNNLGERRVAPPGSEPNDDNIKNNTDGSEKVEIH